MSVLSQIEGDEIFEILVRACDASGPQDTPSLLARISVLLGREVGATALQAIVDKAMNTEPNSTKTG
ncbi:hypothetical protein [Afipia sp. GAS231]|uniref:hypothetical protein n=1 Tax=Afipia sp. GAS231 TaxID=1882747 RepID=UPI00087B936E|nr:hypothetical protein [Afipia sp. GAS231]SDO67658.1 hypothetical protein SAMN05444050_4723 [Afipia sp. GAS231]